MNSIDLWREFFGWASVINAGILIFTSILIVGLRGMISKIHGNMFGLSEEQVSVAYFQYLANYKILIFIFAVVPYFVLRLMS